MTEVPASTPLSAAAPVAVDELSPARAGYARVGAATGRRVGSHYAQALSLVAAGLLVAYALHSSETLADEAMISLLTVVVVAVLYDVRVAVTATVANILAFDYFFVPPRFEFALSDARSTPTFLTMLVVAVLMSGLAQRVRRQEQQALRDAKRANALYALNAELAAASAPRQVAAVAARHLAHLFGDDVQVLLRANDEGLSFGQDTVARALIEEATRVRELRARTSGAGLDVCVPIVGIHDVVGVILFRNASAIVSETEETRHLLSYAHEIATAVERVQLADAMRRTQLEAETERMRSTLLSAVSHDLKSPLAAIVAAAATMSRSHGQLSQAEQVDLLAGIVSEGDRLQRLVQNLLSVTRLEGPSVRLRLSQESVDEIVQAALQHLELALTSRPLSVDIPPHLPLVWVEPGLIGQVLTNLLENALRYSPAGTPIDVRARLRDGVVVVSVEDRGTGISDEERDRVFEKFYRGAGAGKADGGIGLGLTICRAIIREHGGRISLRAREGGGSIAEFSLTMTESHAHTDDVTP